MKSMEEKEFIVSVRDRQKNSVPRDYNLTSLDKPRDARPSGGFFYLHLTPMTDSYDLPLYPLQPYTCQHTVDYCFLDFAYLE